MILYIIYVKPYSENGTYWIDIMNETNLFLVTILLFPLSESHYSGETRMLIGWIIVLLTSANLIINWMNVVINMFQVLVLKKIK